MTIITLAVTESIERLYNEYPFVWSYRFVYDTTATYWTTIFTAPAEVSVSTVVVLGVTINNVLQSEVFTIDDLLSVEGSFWFDAASQTLRVHADHSIDMMTSAIAYGKGIGFSDTTVVDINGILYRPFVKSVPSIEQSEEILNYDKMKFISGSITLDATDGVVDYLLEESLIGNDAIISTYNEESGAIEALAHLYVESLEPGISELVINVQDKRAAQEISFPTTAFSQSDFPNMKSDYSGDKIPIAYGYIREMDATPVDELAASTTVTFKAAITLTALTTVWLKIAEKWTVATPSNINLDSGTFQVANAKSSTTAAPYACKIECTGIPNTHASDVIKDLYSRYANTPFLGSYFDISEWTEEESALAPIGVVWTDTTKIYEAIADIQNGSNLRFRFEINVRGLRTIRINNTTREPVVIIDSPEIMNRSDLKAKFDTENLAASVRIGYQKSYVKDNGKFITVANNDYSDIVLTQFRNSAEIRIDTMLASQSLAATRAAADARFLSQPIKTVAVVVRNMGLRIYDMGIFALTPDDVDLITMETLGREFLGIQIAQVVGVDPDLQSLLNTVSLRIIEQAANSEDVRITEDAQRRVTEDGQLRVTG